MKLQRVGVWTGLYQAANNNRLNPDKAPVLKIDVSAIRWLLQHVAFCQWREASATTEVVGDHLRHIERCTRRAALPTERHNRNRRRLSDALYVDNEFSMRLRVAQGHHKQGQSQFLQHIGLIDSA